MKTILVTSSEITVARNLLRTDFLKKLLSNTEVHVVLAVPAGDHKSYKEEFGGERVTVVGVERPRETFFSRIVIFVARNAHRSRTIRWVQDEQYFLDAKVMLYLVRLFTYYVVGSIPLMHRIIRAFDRRITTDPAICKIFDEYRPDMLLATVLFRDVDVQFAREAKRRGIKLLGMMRSWDNCTTYGHMRVVPDVFLSQSAFISEMAIRYQKIPAKRIILVGAPLYDLYIKKEIIWSREKFLKYFGLPSDSLVALFGAVGTFLFTEEEQLIGLFNDLLKKKLIPSALRFIYRAHPSFPVRRELPDSDNGVIVHRTGGTASQIRGDMLAEDEDLYINSLFHADVVITTASTVGVEAALFDKPVISIDFDHVKPPVFARSPRVFQTLTHVKEMMKCRGMRRVASQSELASAISGYLRDPSQDAVGRRCIRERLLEPLDEKSSERMVEYVTKALFSK
jgi:hypothetical protein